VSALRILVHDFAGHPFQVQLSRALARRGHAVLHHHLANNNGPQGALARRDDDPPGFASEPLYLRRKIDKRNYLRRLRQDFEYGRTALAAARRFKPDVFIASNLPLDTLGILQRELQDDGCLFILWWQDIYSIAMAKILPTKFSFVGRLVAERYRWLERRIARHANAVVCITDDFIDVLADWGIDRGKAITIENWAPFDEIRPLTSAPAWAREHGLHDRPVLLYSGTLGLKHNPQLLWRLAERLAADPQRADACVVVVSEGIGADWLAARLAENPDVPLTLLPFQPYDRFSEVLASATVVAAVLEPDAGVFSVPSKVLSYMAAGRPILLAAPAINLASRTVAREHAGMVVEPDDEAGFVDAALALLDAPARAERLGAAGRAYAERAFDIETIADRFEALWAPPASGAAPPMAAGEPVLQSPNPVS
jgi:glycosyltransferase involved in cell wall biosynthesis